MSEQKYNLTFVANDFVLNTTITAENEEQAEANVVANLQDWYGIDLDKIKCSLDIEEIEND